MSLDSLPEKILAELKEVEAEGVALFTGEFKISEVFEFLEAVGDVVASVEGITKDELKATLLEAWTHYNSRFQIIEKLDELVKLPAMFEPFDAMAFELAIKQLIIPGIVSLSKLP